MTALHISHTVSDFDSWLEAFEAHEDLRATGGVLDHIVRRGVDEPNVVAIDLRFGGADAARAFLARLRSEVWSRSPFLIGTPTVQLLDDVERSARRASVTG